MLLDTNTGSAAAVTKTSGAQNEKVQQYLFYVALHDPDYILHYIKHMGLTHLKANIILF